MYLQYYQKQLNQKVEEYKSSQLVIEMDEKISGPMLREMEGLPVIKSVKRVLPLISDNQYLICPYLESDFFTRGIKQSLHNDSHTGVYINYETYRGTKDQAIEIEVEGKSFTVQPDYQLDKTFPDYKFGSNWLESSIFLMKIIWIFTAIRMIPQSNHHLPWYHWMISSFILKA